MIEATVLVTRQRRHSRRKWAGFGIGIPVVRPDLPAVLARAASIVQRMCNSLQESFSGQDNPVLVSGDARFAAREETSFRLTVGNEEIRAGQVVVHTK